jgi:hypothetical protein
MRAFHFPNTDFGLLNFKRPGSLRRCVTASPDEPFAERDLWNILGGLLRFDVGGTYHLAPLLGFICDELAEVGR